jgi:hypothetical protein
MHLLTVLHGTLYIIHITIYRTNQYDYWGVAKVSKPKSRKQNVVLADQSNRAMYNRAVRQEDLRERITNSQVLSTIERIEKELLDDTRPMEAIDVARRAKALDSCHRRLDKILPSLKSVEITKTSDDNLALTYLSDDAREQLRQAILDSIGARALLASRLPPASAIVEGEILARQAHGGAGECEVEGG